MRKYELMINGKKFDVEVRSLNNGLATVIVNGDSYQVEVLGEQVERITPHPASTPAAAPSPLPVSTPAPVAAPPPTAAPPTPAPAAVSTPTALDLGADAGPGDVTAPMPGLILEVKVGVGDAVKNGDVVVRMEAMKMENDILAVKDGVVSKVHVEKGAEVQGGQVLVSIGD